MNLTARSVPCCFLRHRIDRTTCDRPTWPCTASRTRARTDDTSLHTHAWLPHTQRRTTRHRDGRRAPDVLWLQPMFFSMLTLQLGQTLVLAIIHRMLSDSEL